MVPDAAVQFNPWSGNEGDLDSKLNGWAGTPGLVKRAAHVLWSSEVDEAI